MNHSKYVSSPSFCVIAPTNYLIQPGVITTNTHLVLAHLVDSDPTYAEFYHARGSAGDFIIMDNGAYELKTPYCADKLISLGGRCGARALVLPDYPFEPAQKTIDAAIEWAPVFKTNGFDCMFVPQSERGDMSDWIRAYTWGTTNPLIDVIGMSILGIPNAIPEVDPTFARVVMSQVLINNGLFKPSIHHHYLGLNGGPATEIPSLLRMGVLDTLDSSGPVWAAITGHKYSAEYDSYQSVKKIKMPVQFDYPLSKDQDTLARIQHNVAMTTSLFSESANASAVWYAQE